MAYCRFSDDCHNCDVYVYWGFGGYNIHVAKTRAVSDAPRPQLTDNPTHEEYITYWNMCAEWLENAQLTPIELPYAGESFVYESAHEAAEKLIELKELGYAVPQHAIDALFEVDRGN